MSERPNENIFVGKVTYGEADIRSRHTRVFSETAKIVSRFAAENRPLVERIKPATFLAAMAKEVIASQLVWNCLTGKHDRFRNEQEVRYLLMNLKQLFDDVRKALGTKRYIEAPLPLREPSNIVEIIVGGQTPAGAEQEVAAFLRSQGYGYPIPVVRSAVLA